MLPPRPYRQVAQTSATLPATPGSESISSILGVIFMPQRRVLQLNSGELRTPGMCAWRKRRSQRRDRSVPAREITVPTPPMVTDSTQVAHPIIPTAALGGHPSSTGWGGPRCSRRRSRRWLGCPGTHGVHMCQLMKSGRIASQNRVPQACVCVEAVWKLRVGVESYYLSQVASGLDEYYTGAGEAPGVWVGNGVESLGLVGEVEPADLRAVLAGLAPGTGFDAERHDAACTSSTSARVRPDVLGAEVGVGRLRARRPSGAASDRHRPVRLRSRSRWRWLEREACFVRRGTNKAENRDPGVRRRARGG